MDTRKKIITMAEMDRRFSTADSAASPPVVAAGLFDILRPEHVRRLVAAREPGAPLVVIVYARRKSPGNRA